MGQRLDLQALLEALLETSNVYFQPPPTVKMDYPAIVYSLDDIQTDYANDAPYNHQVRYQVTVMDRNSDSEIPGKVADLRKCSFDRAFTADGLNHFVFNLFF